MNLKKYINNQNWNIGFVNITAERLLYTQKLGKIEWMKHPYRDRFFADPFVLSADEERIIVFAEELEFDKPIGHLVELVIDVKTKQLLERFVLLQLDTHLSYPIIKKQENKIYVYPENGASGKLLMYEYVLESHSLKFIDVIIEEYLADATIIDWKDKSYLFATKVPLTQENLYLYSSSKFGKGYKEVGLVETKKSCSRPGGNLFVVNNKLYRPAQNCEKRYGGGLNIMEVIGIEDIYEEKKVVSLQPNSFKYNLGLHTINFYDKGCVVDGYGYLYPILGRIHYIMWLMKKSIKNLLKK